MSWSVFERKFGPIEELMEDATRVSYQKIQQRKVDTNLVWSVTEGDNGELYVSPGYHVVNMMGYILSAKPWSDHDMADLWVKW